MSAAAGTCPHCQARIDPRRILRMTRRRPYTCPSCAGTARLDPGSGAAVLVGYIVAIAVPLFLLEYVGASRTVLFVACIIAALAIPFVFARFSRFEPAEAIRQH